jgi:TPR repeat protein
MSKQFAFIMFFFIVVNSAFASPPDLWKTAIRPDYAPIDAYVRQCGPSCGKTPEEVADKITATCASDIEKARAIFDWLAFNIGYDTTYRISSPEGAFKYRNSVCQGYAMLFCQMAEHVGLKADLIEGDAKNNLYYRPGSSRGQGGGHAWNIVSLDDRDIIIDPTWGAGYVDGGSFRRFFKSEWFDPHPAVAVFTHIPSSLTDELLEPLVSDALFDELPYIQPNLAYSGLDPCEIFSFFYEHPECDAPMCYYDFNQEVHRGLRLEKIPLASTLRSDTEYEFRYRPAGTSKLQISGSTERINEDGSISLFITGKSGSRISVGRANGGGIMLEYAVNNSPSTFSKRTVIPVAPPRAVRRPQPISVVLDFVRKGDSPTSGFFMSAIESAEEQWKKFERDDSFAKSFLHPDKALKKKYKFNPSWMPSTGFTIDQVVAYCNWKSAEEGLTPCYSLDENGAITCDLSASGYRVPTCDEWLYAATDGTGVIPENNEALAENAWFQWDSGGVVHTVGTRKPTANGIHDLFGNVPEICYDPESGTYVTTGGGAGDAYQDVKSMKKTPAGPDGILAGCIRVVRNAPTDADDLDKTGVDYLFGGNLDQDYAKALLWLTAAIDAGNVPAVNTLGYMYANGYGVAKDTEKALAYFRTAAEKSDINACYNVAYCLDNGIGTEPDKKEAFTWYGKAAEIGNPGAQYKLAEIYAKGETVGEDPVSAYNWMCKAAAAGNTDAMTELSGYYRNGYGTAKDEGKAFELFRKLAEKDSVFGMIQAADAYAAGKGTKQNWYSALRWYRDAEQKGSQYASAKIAECLYYGHGTKRDIDRAIETLTRLRDAGWTDSADLLARATAAQTWLASQPSIGKAMEDNMPDGADPAEYMKSFADMDAALKELSGKGLANPLLYNSLKPEDIQKKTVIPLQNAISGKPLAVYKKILLIITSADYSESSPQVKTVFHSDVLNSGNRAMNGERYRFDQTLFGYYDAIIPLRQDCVSKMLTTLAPLIGDGVQTDVLDLDVPLFSTIGQKNAAAPAYQTCLHDLWKAEIDKGLRPRLIWLGNATDKYQLSLNGLFPGDETQYAAKMNMFGTPFAMTGELSLGFRNGKLLVCMLSNAFMTGKAFRILLDESGVCQGTTTKAPTTVPDEKTHAAMRALKTGVTATIAKPGKVVMLYSVVRPKY